MTVVHELRVDCIVVGKRLREPSVAVVSELAESIRNVGHLLHPITVWRPSGVVPRLVSGAHRLDAAKLLGWKTIDCHVLPEGTTEDDCLQIEIAENLHRSELTKDERDRHIRLLAELVARKEAQEVSTQNAAKPKSGPLGGRPQGVVAKVAEQTGLSKDTVRRALNPEAEAERKAQKDAERQQRAAEQAELDTRRDPLSPFPARRTEAPTVEPPSEDARQAEAFSTWMRLSAELGNLDAQDILAGLVPRERARFRQQNEALSDIIDILHGERER